MERGCVHVPPKDSYSSIVSFWVTISFSIIHIIILIIIIIISIIIIITIIIIMEETV